MPTVELKQVVGKFLDQRTQRAKRVAWDMDLVLLDGRQIATINRVPGAAVGLLRRVVLSPAERTAVEEAIAAQRGGVKPCKIGSPVKVPYEILDDDEDAADTAAVEAGDELETEDDSE